jgi:hypothetical protein
VRVLTMNPESIWLVLVVTALEQRRAFASPEAKAMRPRMPRMLGA